MKTQIQNTALAAMLAMASAGAFAAGSADLAVNGKIRPPACDVTLSDGGVADFGTVSSLTLRESTGMFVDSKSMTLTVACDAPTKVGISSIDNRAGTVGATASQGAAGPDKGYLMGLGTHGGKTIGAHAVKFMKAGAAADGSPVDSIYSSNGGTSWVTSPGVVSATQAGVTTHGWAVSGSTVPGFFRTVVQPLLVELFINAKNQLATGDEIPLDGLVTLQVQYL